MTDKTMTTHRVSPISCSLKAGTVLALPVVVFAALIAWAPIIIVLAWCSGRRPWNVRRSGTLRFMALRMSCSDIGHLKVMGSTEQGGGHLIPAPSQ